MTKLAADSRIEAVKLTLPIKKHVLRVGIGKGQHSSILLVRLASSGVIAGVKRYPQEYKMDKDASWSFAGLWKCWHTPRLI